MNILKVTKDGGPESTVWAHWLVEMKRLFSVALLRFEDGTRDAYHNHAFESVSWVLKGELTEEHLNGKVEVHRPSLRPVRTHRGTFHRVRSKGRTWVLTFRGPWERLWAEYIPAERRVVTLSDGRKEIR